MSDSIDSLRKIFNDHPAGRAATNPLKRGTQVGLSIYGDDQCYHFVRTAEGATIVAGAGEKTDFDLILGAKAVEEICQTQGESVGDFGVSFLRSLLREADDERVQVKLHAGLITLTRNGYLKVLAMGGPKVLGFLSKEGYIGPRGIAKAIRRLRSN